jgi:hypothetical protein
MGPEGQDFPRLATFIAGAGNTRDFATPNYRSSIRVIEFVKCAD